MTPTSRKLSVPLLVSCIALMSFADGPAGRSADSSQLTNKKGSRLSTLSRALSDMTGGTPTEAAAEPGTNIGILRYVRLNITAPGSPWGGSAIVDYVWGEFFRDTNKRDRNYATIDRLGGAPLRSCVSYEWNNEPPLVFRQRANPLGAGRRLFLNGPLGSRHVDRRRPGVYDDNPVGAAVNGSVVLPLFLAPGIHTVDNGSGGAAVGSFTARMVIPESPKPFTWTNMQEIATVQRDRDLTVTWSGGDPGKEYVVIGGVSLHFDEVTEMATGGYFVCSELMALGKFTVPSSILMSLPATPAGALAIPAVFVGRTPRLTAPNFTAPGLDSGFFTYSEGAVKMITYQ